MVWSRAAAQKLPVIGHGIRNQTEISSLGFGIEGVTRGSPGVQFSSPWLSLFTFIHWILMLEACPCSASAAEGDKIFDTHHFPLSVSSGRGAGGDLQVEVECEDSKDGGRQNGGISSIPPSRLDCFMVPVLLFREANFLAGWSKHLLTF